MMKRFAWLVLLMVSLFWQQPKAWAACTGSVQCERWDPDLGACTTVGQETISCVESGNSCEWQNGCPKCPTHGTDCNGTPDGTTPSPPPGSSCFPAGTKVLVEGEEERRIEQIKVGDRVVSQNEAGDKAVSRVAALETPVRDHMCRVEFKDGGSLRLTDEHPLFTQDGWKSIVPAHTAKENAALKVGALTTLDRVQYVDGSMAQI